MIKMGKLHDNEAPVEKEEKDSRFYREAFEAFDWNRNGTIATSVSNCYLRIYVFPSLNHPQNLQYAMRRAGQNPTDVEVQDLINKIDDGSGNMDFNDFCLVMKEKTKEMDPEIHFKDTFRAFSKDEEGKRFSYIKILLFRFFRMHPSR